MCQVCSNRWAVHFDDRTISQCYLVAARILAEDIPRTGVVVSYQYLAKELESRGHNVLLVDYQPTSEMMVIDFAQKIKKHLPSNIKLHSLKLRETATSFAEWFASDKE